MKYIQQQELEEMLRLHQDGVSLKALASQFGISDATVSNYVHGRTVPRFLKANKIRPQSPTRKKRYADPTFEEEDLSKRGDDEFFEHVRECNFIG